MRCLFLCFKCDSEVSDKYEKEKREQKIIGKLSFIKDELLYILEWNKRLQHYR